jgi:hypothetical protein
MCLSLRGRECPSEPFQAEIEGVVGRGEREAGEAGATRTEPLPGRDRDAVLDE